MDVLQRIAQHVQGGKSARITTRGLVEFHDDDKTAELPRLYDALGPTCRAMEMIPCTKPPMAGKGIWLYCDEEGVLKNLPKNAEATALLGNQVHGGVLVGNVVVAKG